MLREKLITLPLAAKMLGEHYERVYHSVRVGDVTSINITGEKYTVRLLTPQDVATLQKLFAERDQDK